LNLCLARIAYPVTALGPGRRLALWVAGCPLRCPGCISPELQDPAAGRAVPVERLVRRILRLGPALDGVTLSGGEPFAQAPALAALWQGLAPARPHWDLLAFSGHTLAQLRARPEATELLAVTDLLVAGPYLREQPGGHPLLASANQRLHPLSHRGARLAAAAAGDTPRANLGLGGGRGWLIGILDPEARRRVHLGLGIKRADR
jgi:anaerobic ribonucleoside-triphosphate reductase activating protein